MEDLLSEARKELNKQTESKTMSLLYTRCGLLGYNILHRTEFFILANIFSCSFQITPAIKFLKDWIRKKVMDFAVASFRLLASLQIS